MNYQDDVQRSLEHLSGILGLPVTLGATYGDHVWMCCKGHAFNLVPRHSLRPGNPDLNHLLKDIERSWSEYQKGVLLDLQARIHQAYLNLGNPKLEEALLAVKSLL